MKRTLAILLVMLLCCATCTVAQAQEGSTYTHEGTIPYALDYPAGWIPLSEETRNAILAYGTGMLKDAELSEILAQMKSYEMAMLFHGATGANVALLTQPAPGITTSMFAMMGPTMVSSLRTQLPGVDGIGEPTVVTVGEIEYLLISYQITLQGEVTVGLQAYTVLGENMFIITFGALADTVDMEEMDVAVERMLGSLRLL